MFAIYVLKTVGLGFDSNFFVHDSKAANGPRKDFFKALHKAAQGYGKALAWAQLRATVVGGIWCIGAG